jgi:hypothetical protein
MAIDDASYPPAIEVCSADVMSAIPAHPAGTGTGTGTGSGSGAGASAGDARRAPTATPPAGVAPSDDEPGSPPGTFFGKVVTPPPMFGVWAARPVPRTRAWWRGAWWAAVIAAVLVAGGVVWRIATRGDGEPSGDTGAVSPNGPSDPTREIVARANDLVAQGDREVALDLLARSRRQYPSNAALAYAAGRIYFSKFYWTEGLRNFHDAIRSDPSYRSDPELIKTVLRGFITTPSYNDDLAGFLRDEIGSPAQPFLEETARAHPNPAIRNRAASELRRYR